MSNDLPPGSDDSGLPADDDAAVEGGAAGNGLIERSIEQELRTSYLTYSMSVIVSRALPDVRDGLKPSQRRILVAMNDLNLRPGAARVKCAKISGDTSGNYHPHGESVIYPTLVRMAQEWVTRYVQVDKQGNYGSIAGLPPAQMRYTEARLSPFAMLMLDDLKLDTVDFVPTYDERLTEPSVLPSKFPNLLVNGGSGIAVGMATSIPPHNLGEICRAVMAVMDDPQITTEELMQIVPGRTSPRAGSSAAATRSCAATPRAAARSSSAPAPRSRTTARRSESSSRRFLTSRRGTMSRRKSRRQSPTAASPARRPCTWRRTWRSRPAWRSTSSGTPTRKSCSTSSSSSRPRRTPSR